MRVVGIVAPFDPRGSVPGKNSFFFRGPGGKWAQETCVVCPQLRYVTVEPGNVQGQDRMGVVEGPVDTGPAGSVFGENSFYRETWGTRRGSRHVAKRSSDPWVAYPEVKVQVRDLVRIVGIVATFAPRGVGT